MALNRRMDNEEFKRRLSEVADWKIPATPRETSLNAKKKRGRPSAEEQYQDAREEMFFEEFGGVNPTYPPMLVKLKNQECVCEDCGNTCPSGRKKETKLYETGAKKVRTWREKCLTCNKAKNPFTGAFDLTISEASYVWTDFLRDSKGMYKTKANAAREAMALKSSNPNAIETDQEIITFHPDFKPDA